MAWHSNSRRQYRKHQIPDRRALQQHLRSLHEQMAAQQNAVSQSIAIGNWVIEQEAYPGGKLLARWQPSGTAVVLAVNDTAVPARVSRPAALKTRNAVLSSLASLPPTYTP